MLAGPAPADGTDAEAGDDHCPGVAASGELPTMGGLGPGQSALALSRSLGLLLLLVLTD